MKMTAAASNTPVIAIGARPPIRIEMRPTARVVANRNGK
jgi:hypothetical protein